MSKLRFRGSWLVAAAFALGSAFAAHAGTVASLRIMLHPYTADWGQLPADEQALLESLAGTTLTLAGTTRTGALELALPAPVGEDVAAAMVKKLRVDRSVLWAEAIVTTVAPKDATVDPFPPVQGHRVMVRLKNGVTPVWPTFLQRLSNKLGTTVTFERQIGNVSVLSLSSDQSAQTLADMASSLQDEPEVQYADPVRWAYTFAAPNDPYYGQQWSLNSALAGINAETAWTLQPSAAGVTVAVVDTGILPHPDLVGRVLPGYNFISDAWRARNSTGRGPDATDLGDWSDGECGYTSPSSWHGTFVSGLIAANSNNGIGIAGLAPNVSILPVRTLGVCGGTFDDILSGMLWASGVAIAGVPPNPTPAKVINMSLGGFGPCDQSIQEAIDTALAQGSVVVVAAGNSDQDATSFSPANCSGVITVGAHSALGDLTSYSNWGRRIDLTAPGGDLPLTGLMVGLSNTGQTVAQDPTYKFGAGTSFATPMVAGTAAMLIARDALLTSGRVLDRITGTTRNYPIGAQCTVLGVCGAGMLDAGAAVGSTLPGGGHAPPNAYPVIEYYRADLDHYFITADPAEANFIDTFLAGTFQRTGLYFYAYLNPAVAPPGSQPVCRFYASAAVQINSHWYSANLDECLFVLLNWPGIWNLETANAFYIQVPDANGNCPSGTLPVYRFFDNRRDANHRYSVDLSVRRAMVNRAWAPEGAGPNGIAFCSQA
ncbi:MAG TPA: S8 family peptidase [Casimicrobiaceae bacterium]|nr:S8 family peptidase [Casimicrobiaceae bacterium]